MSEEKKRRELSAYEKKAEKTLKDENRVKNLLNNVTEKLQDAAKHNEKLQQFFRGLKIMSRMVRAFIHGRYKEVPWKSIVVLVAGLLYFVTPIDLIPDFIPALGLLDDAAMVAFIFRILNEDIEAFLAWETKQKLEL